MNRLKLTNIAVEKLKFPTGAMTRTGKPLTQAIFWDTDESGFGVRVSADSKTKTYIYQRRVRIKGRTTGPKQERNFSLGHHGDAVLLPDGTLRRFAYGAEDARTEAETLKGKLKGGTDPVREIQEARENAKRKEEEEKWQAELAKQRSTTLREVLEHFLIHHTTRNGPLRPATQKDYRYHCEKNLASWLDEPVANITRELCLTKFKKLSERAPIQANLCMVYLRALCNHARLMHEDEEGNTPILATNPVTRMIALVKHLNTETARETRIPLERIGKVWLTLQRRRVESRKVDERTGADWACFMVLTGTRRGESSSLKWSDVNLETRTFALRAEVTKNHKPLTLPMSTVLHDLLSQRQSPQVQDKAASRRTARRSDEYVFASHGKKSPHITGAPATFDAISDAAGTPINRHDLRRTFEDIASECQIDGDRRRLLINHKSGDVHAVHYANNRRALLAAVESIAQWVVNQAAIAEAMENGSNVLAFPSKSASRFC